MSTVQCSLFTLTGRPCLLYRCYFHYSSHLQDVLVYDRYFVISIMTKLGGGWVCVCVGGGGYPPYTVHTVLPFLWQVFCYFYVCPSWGSVGGVCVCVGGGYTPYTAHTVLPFFMTDSFYIPHCTDKIVHILAFTVYRHISRVDR